MKIRIRKVNAFGEAFANLTPGSEHEVLAIGDYNGREAYWVEGVDEQVLVLASECTVINK